MEDGILVKRFDEEERTSQDVVPYLNRALSEACLDLDVDAPRYWRGSHPSVSGRSIARPGKSPKIGRYRLNCLVVKW